MGLVQSENEQSGREVETVVLETEWQRQAKRYIELGFHTQLGLTEHEYLESLPKFFLQPESYKGRFDVPLLVETRIPLGKLFKLTDIEDYSFLGYGYKDSDFYDWVDDPQGFKTPVRPYSTWVNDGKVNLNRSINEVRKSLRSDERAGTIFDGIAFFTAYSKILLQIPENYDDGFAGGYSWDLNLGGTSYKSGDKAPWLGPWYSIPCMEIGKITDKKGICCITCGRKLGFRD